MLEGKNVLIIGGTGSLGNVLVDRLLKMGPKKIIIFSRDEAKQYNMKMKYKNLKESTEEVFYNNLDEVLDFRIGDIRDIRTLIPVVKEAHIIINAAALKHVPVCEYFPYESVKTTVEGAQNLVEAVKNTENDVQVVLDVSTDKACKPVNVYGMCKGIQERIIIGANHGSENAKFICVRYGNVISSRGSVIPFFLERIKEGKDLPITHKDMTRFLLSLNQAVDLIFEALKNAKKGETYIPIVPSFKITDLAEVLAEGKEVKITEVGLRPGEKMHEILVSEEEVNRTVKRGNYYAIEPIIPEVREVDIDDKVLGEEFSSENNLITDKEKIKEILKEANFTDYLE